MSKLIQPQVTEPIIGLIFDSYNQLGFGHQERYYQSMFALKLEEAKIPYKRESYVPLKIGERIIGRSFIDFVINDQVVVDWKVANEFYESHIKQVLSYLRGTGMHIGLIARVEPHGVRIKRLVI